jgi:hypothetical protein
MVHLGTTSNELWQSTFDGDSWTSNIRIGQRSKAPPALTIFVGVLHMVHLGDSSNNIFWSTFFD